LAYTTLYQMSAVFSMSYLLYKAGLRLDIKMSSSVNC